jgi:hypothetical protein
MSYYIRVVPQLYGSTPEVWKIENGSAFRIGITNPTVFGADPGETIWDTPLCTVRQPRLRAGSSRVS